MLYSFDIFDTIVYRNVPEPSDIFVLMEQNEELKSCCGELAENFAAKRAASRRRLRITKSVEPTIQEIYSELDRQEGLGQSVYQRLIEIEFETERNHSFLNQSICDEIHELVSSGERVVLISDMYWSGSRLRELLVCKDPVFENIPIYVSCDYNASKTKGTLFRKVKVLEGADYHAWRHTGDNRHSDYRVPKMYGIQCCLATGPKLYKYERELNGYTTDTAKVYGVVVKSRKNSTGEAFDFGASFAAPMVYQYIDWVLQEAERKNIGLLYFVLRDGYILKKVADEIIRCRGTNIRTEFIFGSRVAWRFPSLTVSKLKEVSLWEKSNWIFRYPAYAYVPFARLGFSKEELTMLFGSGFPARELRSFKEFKRALDEALDNADFCKMLEGKIEEAGVALEAYMSETLDQSMVYALVDTNSTGKSQSDLNGFLVQHCPQIRPLKFFYHTFFSDEKPDPKSQYVFSVADKIDTRFPEVLIRAPYNACYGYERGDNGRMRPVFAAGRCSWYESFDYDDYLRGILAFTGEAERVKKDGGMLDITEYNKVLFQVANEEMISKDIISIIGKMPFNPNMDGEEIVELWPKLHFSVLAHPFKDLIYYPKGSFYLTGGLWPALYRVLYGVVELKRRKHLN